MFFTEKTPKKDLNEGASSLTQVESSGKTLAEGRLMEVLLKDVNVMKVRVLGTLKNQEDRIDGLNKALERGEIRVGALEEESMKRKEQVLRMKSLIQPLRDEVVRQKSVIENNLEEKSEIENEIAALKENMASQDRKLEEQTTLSNSLARQLKEAGQSNAEQLVEVGEEWEEIVEEKRKLKIEREKLESVRQANNEKVKDLEIKTKEFAERQFKVKFENVRTGRQLSESEENVRELKKMIKEMGVKEIAHGEQVEKLQKELRELKVLMMEKEVTADTLRGELETKTAECEKLCEVKKGVSKLEENLAKVKSNCKKVKKDNDRLEDKLKKKRNDISRLKKKLVALENEKTLPKETTEEMLQEQPAAGRAFKTNENTLQREGKRKLSEEKETMPQNKKAKVVEHLSDSMEQIAEEIAEELLESSVNCDEMSVEESSVEGNGKDDEDGNDLASTSPFHSPRPLTSPSATETLPCNLFSPSVVTEAQTMCAINPLLPGTSNSSPESVEDIPLPAETSEAAPAALKVRNLENLLEPLSSASRPQIDPDQVAQVLAKLELINLKELKYEMKNQVELAMKKYLHTNNPEVYGQRSWEIFDEADFASVCRALAVKSREEVAEKWNLQHGSLEGIKLSDEDISQMRDSVDFYFHMRRVCLLFFHLLFSLS